MKKELTLASAKSKITRLKNEARRALEHIEQLQTENVRCWRAQDVMVKSLRIHQQHVEELYKELGLPAEAQQAQALMRVAELTRIGDLNIYREMSEWRKSLKPQSLEKPRS